MAHLESKAVGLEDKRPLSPHLQIYRPMLTMMMSIAHRITGVALYGGTLFLAWYLIALASGAKSFATVSAVYGSFIGEFVLFLFTWALFHHFLGGVRHLIWDLGYGMDHPEREYLARGTLVGGIGLAFVVWVAAFLFA